MMLADPDEIDAEFVGENRLLQEIAQNLRLRKLGAIGVAGDVAECVEAEFERFHADFTVFGPASACPSADAHRLIRKTQLFARAPFVGDVI